MRAEWYIVNLTGSSRKETVLGAVAVQGEAGSTAAGRSLCLGRSREENGRLVCRRTDPGCREKQERRLVR